MQEIKKRRILIASVLKPADEPRAFEKIGHTLAANGYDVFISGSSPTSTQTVDSITFLPHKKVERISVSRIVTRFKILRTAFRIRPDLLIVSTHELLGVALLYRLFTRKKIIYDVQENYFKNILYTAAFPKLLRPVVASLVRLKEIIISVFFSGFILAEKCYEWELSFVKKKSVVIENKCKLPENFQRKPTSDFTWLIFTGTLAESTGIFQAIELARRLHALDANIRLDIVGFCALPHVLLKIRNEIKSCDFIFLTGGDHFVSHKKIFDSISSANFGIISYPILPHTKDRIPTKFYEYMACGLPILMQENPTWINASTKYDAILSFDFSNYDTLKILHQLKTKSPSQSSSEATWSIQEFILTSFIKETFS